MQRRPDQGDAGRRLQAGQSRAGALERRTGVKKGHRLVSLWPFLWPEALYDSKDVWTDFTVLQSAQDDAMAGWLAGSTATDGAAEPSGGRAAPAVLPWLTGASWR